MQPIFINQKDNFTANFGDALRSSAIFYYRTGPGFRTTIAFMNYWKSKRNLEVAIVASLRTMAGKLVRRERLRFGDATVLNYSPSVDAATFEGSLEVESFCTENLVIPYSAIMAIYETTSGVTMVHSYARAYSRHEVEDGRCICVGEESCWTLRDRPGVRSFGIFHNGPKQMPPQRIVLRVSGQSGRQQAELDLPALAPYQTVKVIPSEHLPHLASLLSGAPGQANLSFQLGEGFTRMLVGNEAVDGSDMQVTHSNFNYASHRTDVIEDPRACGYMYIPDAGISDKTVIIYPDTDSGRYEVTDGSTTTAFVTGEVVTLPCKEGVLRFRRTDGKLPSRIVTAIAGNAAGAAVPFECSLGVLTRAQPPKRLWWGVCAARPDLSSTWIAHDAPEIYGGMPANAVIKVSLHSSRTTVALERELGARDVDTLGGGIPLHELFDDPAAHLGSDFGYYTAFSEYPGLTWYSTLANQRGSLCLEHGF